MNPLKRLAGETAIYGFSSIAARILNYLLVVLYTRVFTAELYGVINELYAYAAFLIVILTYGMETGFFRFINKYVDQIKIFSTTLFSLFISSVSFIILLFLTHEHIALVLDYEMYSNLILMLGITVAVDAFSTIPFVKLRSENRAVRFVTLKVFNIVVNITFNLFFLLLLPQIKASSPDSFILFIYDSSFGIGYVILSNLIATILTLILLIKEIAKFRPVVSFSVLKNMLGYSVPLLVSGLAGTINESIDRILLRWRLPETINAQEQLGIYGANIRIAVLMILFIQTFRYAAEPFFFNYQKQKGSKELYAQVMKYFVILGIFIFLGITLFIDFFKHIIGSDFHEGLSIVPIVLVGNLLLGVYFNLSIWYKLTDMTRYGAYLAILGALVTIIINYTLIPVYGYIASAWAHVACYLVMCVLSYNLGKKYYKIPYDFNRIVIYFIAGGLIYFTYCNVNIEVPVARYLFSSLLIAIYCLLVYYREKDEILHYK